MTNQTPQDSENERIAASCIFTSPYKNREVVVTFGPYVSFEKIKEALDAKDIHWQEIVNHNEKIKMNPNFKNFIIGAIKEVNFIQGLDNELARMSALNRLSGYLEGGLEMIEFMEKENKNG